MHGGASRLHTYIHTYKNVHRGGKEVCALDFDGNNNQQHVGTMQFSACDIASYPKYIMPD
jgi:hypothetical protein